MSSPGKKNDYNYEYLLKLCQTSDTVLAILENQKGLGDLTSDQLQYPQYFLSISKTTKAQTKISTTQTIDIGYKIDADKI